MCGNACGSNVGAYNPDAIFGSCRVDTLACVNVFMKTFGQTRDFNEYEDTQAVSELIDLRIKLIEEEFNEFKKAALDFKNSIKFRNGLVNNVVEAHNASLPKLEEMNDQLIDQMTEMYDGLLDLIYVVDGAFVAFGLDKEFGFKEVQASNMSKLGEDGKPIYNEYGKVMKGPNYFKPNLRQFVETTVKERISNIDPEKFRAVLMKKIDQINNS